MLNAAEAAMWQSAADDTERERMRAALYAPPRGQRRPTKAPGRAAGMTTDHAQALIARLAAEDSKLDAR